MNTEDHTDNSKEIFFQGDSSFAEILMKTHATPGPHSLKRCGHHTSQDGPQEDANRGRTH
eukprot:jgi/Botrbrau1/11667/Bobra.168_2s0022.1